MPFREISWLQPNSSSMKSLKWTPMFSTHPKNSVKGISQVFHFKSRRHLFTSCWKSTKEIVRKLENQTNLGRKRCKASILGNSHARKLVSWVKFISTITETLVTCPTLKALTITSTGPEIEISFAESSAFSRRSGEGEAGLGEARESKAVIGQIEASGIIHNPAQLADFLSDCGISTNVIVPYIHIIDEVADEISNQSSRKLVVVQTTRKVNSG